MNAYKFTIEDLSHRVYYKPPKSESPENSVDHEPSPEKMDVEPEQLEASPYKLSPKHIDFGTPEPDYGNYGNSDATKSSSPFKENSYDSSLPDIETSPSQEKSTFIKTPLRKRRKEREIAAKEREKRKEEDRKKRERLMQAKKNMRKKGGVKKNYSQMKRAKKDIQRNNLRKKKNNMLYQMSMAQFRTPEAIKAISSRFIANDEDSSSLDFSPFGKGIDRDFELKSKRIKKKYKDDFTDNNYRSILAKSRTLGFQESEFNIFNTPGKVLQHLLHSSNRREEQDSPFEGKKYRSRRRR
eukprot:TRINITY_DN2017_c0_g1_i1.p1 TRINITY_DN2017_c0_g1~~TRINITY_DN2017_c0_g1_i1.p1  ORF type:complete len:297 (+),score=84.11 TRINITY_DN2017_c0_g1_i1:202-1092(+)